MSSTAVQEALRSLQRFTPDVEAVVEELPPSAQTVYRELKEQGPLTHKDLVEATGMPPRTVRYAVSRLRESGILGERCNLMDCRQCFFFIEGKCEGGVDEVRKNHLGRIMGTFE